MVLVVLIVLRPVLAAPSSVAGSSCTRTVAVPILMYHRIDTISADTPAITRRLTVDPRDFAAQMHWLARHDYRTATQDQLLAAMTRCRALGPRTVLITFDDGYRDVFLKASSTLRRLGFKATAYVITSRISAGDSSFLTWPLLRALERRGIEIGSHTVNHLDLTSVPTETAWRELTQSRLALEQALHHRVRWLAYPSGRYDERVLDLARRAGYKLAVTTRQGTLQSPLAPLELSRLRILDTTGVAGFAKLLRRS